MEDGIRKEEETKLEQTIGRIDQIVDDRKQWCQKGKEETGTGETLRETRRIYEECIRNLEEARPTPYFGRVDFEPATSPAGAETYYIGKYHIEIDYVYSFWAPVAALYYDPTSNGYKVPKSGDAIDGTVRLTRHLQIENTSLVEYRDVYRLATPGAKAMHIHAEESPLAHALAKRRTGQLRDIVETIQPQQYQQIVAGFRGVIIVQGVAGSGKSEVGIHRLAYLLSPHGETKLTPEEVIFFGPSKVFLRYISSMLPELEIPKIKQRTIFDWLRSTLSHSVKTEPLDRLLEKDLRGSIGKLPEGTQVARLKGSLAMARILDKYAKSMRTRFIGSATDIVVGHRKLMAKATVKKIARKSTETHLNEARKRVLQQVESEIRKKLDRLLEPQLQAEIEKKFSEFWPEVDFANAYFDLLSNRDSLATASKNTLTENELEIVVRLSQNREKKFKREDLPALCYLDHAINDRLNLGDRRQKPSSFSHAVVDEAQDVSPLEFTVLKLHSRNGAFTILGDLGQRLLPHWGISSWREVKNLFPEQNIRYWEAPYSYRSTYEITKYARRILTKIAPRAPRPRPYQRHGERPVFVRSKTFQDMVDAIARDIRTLSDQGMQTVAVLCKTALEASELRKKLARAGISNSVLLDKRGDYDSKVVISSIFTSKGLEYDAVILANARERNYPSTEMNGRLLYIAVTRAAHKLHVHWFGPLAKVLAVPGFFKEPNEGHRQEKGKKLRR
ncbi:MAG: 3'-5' exonuclease [Dehalococcoidia bacterium]|nr:3'-5' exonuclease [Dehalococcoidia bacterium]